MKVSYRWLASFFPPGAFDDLPPAEFARRLTAQGLPVDEVRPAFQAFEGVVLGKVVDAGPHPNADRLTLCQVESGDGARQVVCGAPNVEVGAIYGYATVGSRLPGEREIRRAKIRGVTLSQVVPLPVEPGPVPFDTYKYNMSVIGHYDQIGQFLADVASLQRIIVPYDLTLDQANPNAGKALGDTTGSLLEAKFQVRTFVKSSAPEAASGT